MRKYKKIVFLILFFSFFLRTPALAATPDPGGNTTVVNPNTDGAVSITEDAVQPESANIRLIVPTLSDPGGGTPNSVRIISVTGGTLWQADGSTLTLGTSGSILSLSSGKVNLRFRPTAGRDTDASFTYVVVDPHDTSNNSTASTATISITAVNDEPVLQTATGSTGLGLAATYYLNSWELTGSVLRRVDSTINFGNDFGVSGLNEENFSVRWSGKVKAPVTGEFVFSTVSDDGVRLWVNDNLIIDNWTLHGDTIDTADAVTLEANTLYTIRMEFYERGGGETARLRWSYPGQATEIIPTAYLFPAVARPTMDYFVGAGATIIDDLITVSDVDSSSIGRAVVTISNFLPDQDGLVFTNQLGITGSYDAGILTLTGTTTLSNYEIALRSVKYINTSTNPNTSPRVIDFVVNDGAANSNAVFRSVQNVGLVAVPEFNQIFSFSTVLGSLIYVGYKMKRKKVTV